MKNLLFISIILIFSSCSKEKRSDKAGEKMQDFIINISNYAHCFDPDFIIIPQNGPELSYNHLDPSDGVNTSYINCIDGFGIEELFYNGSYSLDGDRLDMLTDLGDLKPVLVAEYITNNNLVDAAIEANNNEGFLCFPRTSSNYDYQFIPEEIESENDLDIHELSDAQNYLYLISTDNYNSQEEMIDDISSTNYDLIIIDLFFNESTLSPAEIEQLKIKENGGERLVISYLNIGSAEKYRYYWEDNWKLNRPNFLKKEYEGYEDEIWVKFWKDKWKEIIYGNNDSYTKKVIDAGFDGVYLDNVEAYYFLYFE